MSVGVSTFSAVCVAVNMMIGAGFLAFPSGFHNGGIIASSVVVAVVCYWMMISCTWEGRCAVHCNRVLKSGRKIPEVTEAFFVFCGKFWRDIYAVVLSISFLSCTWVLAILFAHTMSSSIPSIYHPEQLCAADDDNDICNTRYLINVAILAIITTPLALMDIGEQWWIQNTLTAVRVVRILLMIITPMIAVSESDMAASFPITYDKSTVTYPNLFFGSWNGLAHVLSAAVFSQYLNASVPIIVDSLKDRNNYLTTMRITFGVCLVLYVWLSITVTMKFGSDTLNPCNINWTGYRWPFCSATPGSLCDLTAKAVEFIIVFCPAVDVASAFPFIGIVLGNSLTEIVLGTPPATDHQTDLYGIAPDGMVNTFGRAQTGTAPASASVDAGPPPMTLLQYKLYNKIFRFLMNSLPMILAVSVSNFSLVIQVTGGISVLICLVFPAFLSIRCTAFVERLLALISVEEGQVVSFNEYFSAVPDGALTWVDGLYSTTGAVVQGGKHSYGAIPIPDNLPSPPGGRSRVGITHDGEIIEKKWFKEAFLWMGLVITVLILYISLQ
jgi:amino acid permease